MWFKVYIFTGIEPILPLADLHYFLRGRGGIRANHPHTGFIISYLNLTYSLFHPALHLGHHCLLQPGQNCSWIVTLTLWATLSEGGCSHITSAKIKWINIFVHIKSLCWKFFTPLVSNGQLLACTPLPPPAADVICERPQTILTILLLPVAECRGTAWTRTRDCDFPSRVWKLNNWGRNHLSIQVCPALLPPGPDWFDKGVCKSW